jgi:hypothetical protein
MKPRAPLRVGGLLRPVIGRRDRTGPRIRGRAPLSLFWLRCRNARDSGPPKLPSMASWSLSLTLLQKIVLGLRDPARLEAGAKAPQVPTAPAVAAWRGAARSKAPRQLPVLPARQLWVSGAKPASPPAASRSLSVAPLAAAATPTLLRRAAPRPVAAVSPTGFPMRRLMGTLTAFRRASAGSDRGQREPRDRWRVTGVAGGRLAPIGAPKADALPARLVPRRSASAQHASALRRVDRPVAAARIDASPVLRTADRSIVTVVYRRREAVVGDAPAPARRRAAELVWPAAPRPGVQTGLPSPALAPFAAVVREAPVAVAARIAAPAAAVLPTLPGVDGLVDEVMRRIDRRFRSERLRRGL